MVRDLETIVTYSRIRKDERSTLLRVDYDKDGEHYHLKYEIPISTKINRGDKIVFDGFLIREDGNPEGIGHNEYNVARFYRQDSDSPYLVLFGSGMEALEEQHRIDKLKDEAAIRIANAPWPSR